MSSPCIYYYSEFLITVNPHCPWALCSWRYHEQWKYEVQSYGFMGEKWDQQTHRHV